MADLTEEQKAARKRLSFFEKLPEDIEPMRQLLATYSKIEADDIDAHLYAIRDQAWAIHPYPCIGRFTFLGLGVVESPAYREALRRLADPARPHEALLDLGCCFGQVLRRLASDGVDPHRLFGADLHRAFIDLGYALFRDTPASAPYTFVAGDLLGDVDNAYDAVLRGRVSLIHAANFFHLFSRPEQVAAAARMVGFLRPDVAAGALCIFGSHMGSCRPGDQPVGFGSGRPHFLHDAASFQALWDEVGAQTGTRWRADVEVTHPVRPGSPLDAGGCIQYVRYAVYQV